MTQASLTPENSAQAVSRSYCFELPLMGLVPYTIISPNSLEPENKDDAFKQEPEPFSRSGTTNIEVEAETKLHQHCGAERDGPSDRGFKNEGAPFHAVHIRPESKRNTEPPMTSQDVSREIEKEDAVHEHTAEQGTNNLNPSSSIADTAISSEATRISLFCSPMGASNRGYEESSIYAIPGLLVIDEKLEGVPRPYLMPTEPQVSRPDLHIDCVAEEGEKILGEDNTTYRSKSPQSFTETVRPSSPLAYEPRLQLSSPTLMPSSPPTSSPPPVSSRPSSPTDGPDTAVPRLFLTDLPNMTSSDPEIHSPERGVSKDNLSPPKNGVVMVVSDARFELDKLGQKEQKKAVYRLPPNPKRPTSAAQRRQHEKLSRPFRPPCLVRLKAEGPRLASDRMRTEDVKNNERVISQTMLMTGEAKESQGVRKGGGSKKSTTKAGAQFKSPLITSTRAGTGDTSHHNDSAVRLTPMIQMLERKLQLLKRAIKIKEDQEEDKLRGLITKWIEAGREIAWEVWAIVKDNNTDEGHSAITGKRSLQHFWHWEMGAGKRHKGEEDFCRFSEMADNELEGTDAMERVDLMKESVEDEDPERPHHTLGTMLRQFGIDPQTLGWDDEEEAFRDIGGED